MSICTFSRLSGCSILSTDSCKGCSFRKTDRQLEDGRAKAWERIESLPEKLRVKIHNKYYRRDLKEGRR